MLIRSTDIGHIAKKMHFCPKDEVYCDLSVEHIAASLSTRTEITSVICLQKAYFSSLL